MKVTVVVDTNIIAKEDYVNELRADGSGDVSRPLTVSTNDTPEMIEVEVTGRVKGEPVAIVPRKALRWE